MIKRICSDEDKHCKSQSLSEDCYEQCSGMEVFCVL